MKFKSMYLIVLLYFCLPPNCDAQNEEVESNAQQDWEYLNYMKNFFCKAPYECKEYNNMDMLEGLQFVDKVYTNRSKLAEAFLDKYQNDPHYDEALTLFFSSYFTPTFISKKMDTDRTMSIANLPKKGQSDVWSQAYRLLAINSEAQTRWLAKGNELIAHILASNAAMERKAKAEILLFNRDYGLASKGFAYMAKDSKERDYWSSMERIYFESFALRLEGLMGIYPESETLAKYIQLVLDDIRGFSPDLAKIYTDRFFIKSGNDNSFTERPGIKLLHALLSDNLKALEVLEFNAEKPLEMAFTALDGRKIDLAKMKGKVVLIDFWSTSCAPCIKAMPHFKIIYDKYKDKGFEIIGIAANGDGDKDLVMKVMKQVNATWPQRLDRGKDASVSFHALYEIKVLPTVWLLDPNGTLVEKDVKGPQLESLVRKYLNL